VALVALPSASAVYDHRYSLPLLVALPVGAALATRHWLAPRPPEDPREAATAPVRTTAARDAAPPVEGVPA
jgi:hypothetical protein